MDCQREISSNTPEGWDAKVVEMLDGKLIYCYAETSLDGILATIPVMTHGWQHAEWSAGCFGYKMIGGHPWHAPWCERRSDGVDITARIAGAEINMRREKGRTSVSVSSHPLHYKETIDLAQEIIDQARSGYLRLNDASAAQL